MKMQYFSSILIALAMSVAAASAHPLGNFSINQYSRLEVSTSSIRIRQVLDMAEIPTVQESSAIDTDHNGKLSQAELDAYSTRITPSYLTNLQLMVDGAAVSLDAVSAKASLGAGAGNLPTLRVVWDIGAAPEHLQETNTVSFRNLNFDRRVGWNEIVIGQEPGISVFDSTAFGTGLTDELKAYPLEFLSSPLAERTADFSFTDGKVPEGAKPLTDRNGHVSAIVQKDKLAELITVSEITPMVALIGLLLAFGLGAVHAMSPGHGKTIVGAYLVGSRGTAKHAAFLGLTVTVTHTLGVFALGLITLLASSYVLPERLMPFLSFVSGLLVFYIGIALFRNRLSRALGRQKDTHDHHHEHTSDGHSHSHDGLTHTYDGHSHTHLPPEQISWRSLLALGISGGLLPCPSALVLMLSAISLGRVGYGLILTLVFSLGLAATLTSVGLVFLYIGRAFGGRLGQNRLVKALPVFSALVVACLGAAICYSSLG